MINHGNYAGALQEAKKYGVRTQPISRQEYERTMAQAQIDSTAHYEKMLHEGGKLEYVWNVWCQTKVQQASIQFEEFTNNMLKAAYEHGFQMGIAKENMTYMAVADELIQANGGNKTEGRPKGGYK
jgi:hypothetical protein